MRTDSSETTRQPSCLDNEEGVDGANIPRAKPTRRRPRLCQPPVCSAENAQSWKVASRSHLTILLPAPAADGGRKGSDCENHCQACASVLRALRKVRSRACFQYQTVPPLPLLDRRRAV